jgi:pyridoxine kinase
MAILSIQSAVAYGRVGNAAAVFPLERLGFEVWRVDTVLFSNHTGYGKWRGRVLESALVGELVAGIEERGVFPGCAAVLSGYLGTTGLGEIVLDAVRRVKRANPEAIYCCDPVMGDADRGLFVKPELPDFFRRAVASADILTPNRFELETLIGGTVTTLAAARAATAKLLASGPRVVLVTSLAVGEVAPTDAAMLVATSAGGWLVKTPRLAFEANGAGDLTAAVFLAHYLRTHDAAPALAATAAGVHAVLAETARRGGGELALVAAQDALVTPPRSFAVERIY